MENCVSILLLLLSFVYVGDTVGIKHEIDLEANTESSVFKALIDRLDSLEKAVAQHPHELEALRHEFKSEIDDLRQSHAVEIASLKAEFVSEISGLKHARKFCNEDVGTAKDAETLEEHVSAKPKMEAVETVDSFVAHNETDAAVLGVSGGEGVVNELDAAASATNKAVGHRFGTRGRQVPTQRIVRAGDDVVVAFLATLNADQVHIGLNQNIHFDNVITNIGSAYDPSRGVFKAPAPGTYVFLVSLVTSHRDLGSFGLFHNNQLTTKLFLNGAENDYDGSSNSAVLHMNQGDEFSVKHLDADHGIRGGYYSSVSGFRLFPGLQLSSEPVGK